MVSNEGESLEGTLTTRGLGKMGLQRWMAVSQARRI